MRLWWRNLNCQELSEFDFSEVYPSCAVGFFIHLKMKKACAMLRTTDMYIYEVAQNLGYSDQYYFSRVFKECGGNVAKGI